MGVGVAAVVAAAVFTIAMDLAVTRGQPADAIQAPASVSSSDLRVQSGASGLRVLGPLMKEYVGSSGEEASLLQCRLKALKGTLSLGVRAESLGFWHGALQLSTKHGAWLPQKSRTSITSYPNH